MEPEEGSGPIALPPGALVALMGWLGVAEGSAACEQALLAAGRDWGRSQEAATRGGRGGRGDVAARLAEGLAGLEAHGLARAVLEGAPVAADLARSRIRFRVLPGGEAGAEAGSVERVRSLLTAGYLTGWTSSLAGVELACELGAHDDGGGLVCATQPATPVPAAEEFDALPTPPATGELGDLGIELNDLLEMTGDTIVFLDGAGIVRYWNRGAAKMFGYESAEVLGRNVAFLLPRDLLLGGELDRLKAACKAEGGVFNYTTRRLRKDGSTIWVSLSRTVSRDAGGRELGVVATMRDVTAQREREHELQTSRRMAIIGELAAKVAHEVKNPLAGIHAALQVLEGPLASNDPRREVFASIEEEVVRLNEMTQDLLRFAKPLRTKPTRVDLRRFLADLMGDLERLSMAAPGSIDVSGLDPRIEVALDPDLTAQVFRNLILNALQATGGRGPIRLSSRVQGSVVSVDVADQGPGIPKEAQRSIFEPFFTTKSRGTGLGLSIARKNLEAQGGSIRLRSHRGRGAVFRVELPVGA